MQFLSWLIVSKTKTKEKKQKLEEQLVERESDFFVWLSRKVTFLFMLLLLLLFGAVLWTSIFSEVNNEI